MEPLQQPCDLACVVLREHVAFLREQLEVKRAWFQEVLDLQRLELQEAKRDLDVLRQENVKLKTALAQALAEAEFHNENDDRNHTTDTDHILHWVTLLRS